MNIIGLIKDKLTDSVIEKVSNFLGEYPENISLALDKAVPTVLGGIIQNTTTEESAGKVMDVLKDGGHTGEILEDLPNLLGNFDKTQLLITIGTNIFNHFLGNKSNGIVETISSLSNIRKTSAFSLVGLATPLVLGALGKVIAREGMGVSGLMKLLNEQRDAVLAALPPVLINKLVTRDEDSNKKITKEQVKERKKDKEKDTNPNPNTSGGGAAVWIPWVLLALVLIAILFYVFKYKKQQDAQAQTLPIADSTTSSTTMLPDTSSFNTVPKDTLTITTPVEKVEPKPAEATIKDKKAELPKIEDKPVSITESRPAATSTAALNDELQNSTSWVALPNLNFRKGSAEISSRGDVNDLVRFLKNNSKAKIIIAGGSQSSGGTLGEDRAYALREVLLEKGVSESRIEIQPKIVSDVDAKITVKVRK
jgi:outer membrane protein OmpA-like peptidoglycan-associated protein